MRIPFSTKSRSMTRKPTSDRGESRSLLRRNPATRILNTRATRETTPCSIRSVGRAQKRKEKIGNSEQFLIRQEIAHCAGFFNEEVSTVRSKFVTLMIAIALLGAAVPVWAHHAFAAEFDANKPVKFRGTVTKMEWINPHAWIHIDVKGEDGKVTPWMIEAAAPTALLRRGWTKQSLLPGTEIYIEGFQAIDGTNKANGSIITFTDGKKLFVGSSGDGEGPPKQ